MKFLVTGAAGFIGLHVSKRLLDDGYNVVGIDNLNNYYDVNLKKSRLNLIKRKKFTFYKLDLTNHRGMEKLFSNEQFNRVIHLAAQAGVRFSQEKPHSCSNTNLIGHLNVLEFCRRNKVQHLLYASSSSVYGLNCKIPLSIHDPVNYPLSLYAATKRSNELMSHTYSYLYGLPTTGLRFFSVYGPWGRPDMALFKFTKAIISGNIIDVYNYGKIKRDFTYIDDIVEAIIRLQDIIPQPKSEDSIKKDTSSRLISSAPYCVYNIGNSSSIELMDSIRVLEKILGKRAKKRMLPHQPGDVLETIADTEDLYEAIGFKPNTSIKDGIKKFILWYKSFYKV